MYPPCDGHCYYQDPYCENNTLTIANLTDAESATNIADRESQVQIVNSSNSLSGFSTIAEIFIVVVILLGIVAVVMFHKRQVINVMQRNVRQLAAKCCKENDGMSEEEIQITSI